MEKTPLEFVNELKNAAVITAYNLTHPHIVATNKEHEKMTGYKNMELVGRHPRLFQGDLTLRAKEIKESLIKTDTWEGTIVNYTKCGRPYSVSVVITPCMIGGVKFYCALKIRKHFIDKNTARKVNVCKNQCLIMLSALKSI